ncbi:MAG: tetratricopeptide repeat protein [Burkholderiaceae bacterium]|nr:tetratricopeptide repeat protein [Burkholderiaceae bacterium]
MNKHREQLCPLWLSILIGFGVVAALVTSYQRDGEQTQSLVLQPPSELSAAYLEAWLRLKPDSPEYLNLLGTQYVKLHRWESALLVADRLGQLGKDDQTIRQQGLLLELSATEQMAYQYSPDDLRRPAEIANFLNILEKTSQYEWDVSVMRSLAEKARLVGEDALTSSYYKKLAIADSDNATQWHKKLAAIALANQHYYDAAQAYFAASNIAKTVDDKRLYFISALKALESGDQAARACEEGDQRLGELVNDRETLAYMLKLARQVNRNDLVSRYAHELVKRAQLSQGSENSKVVVLTGFSAQKAQSWPYITGARSYLVSTRAIPVENGREAKKSAEYELIFKAFIESNELDDAETIAQKALDAHLDPLVWGRRLAEVAQWNSHPEKAFKYWLLVAQESGNEEAWKHVLTLAPQFEDDAAYLAAWAHTQPEPKQASTNPLASQYVLLEQYKNLGHWESALRVARTIKDQGDTKERQDMLLLEATITEQLAYKYQPDDPQRVEGLARFIKVLEQTSQYEWGIPEMTWLAQKARETGANDLVGHYYQKLAVVDASNASKWQEQIGNMALGQQAYEEASTAYFAAQDAATVLEEKRFYFLAALKAFVANGQLVQACQEAEKRAGNLAQDPKTLRYLINLARQANRRDLMSRYARDLITYSDQSHRNAYYSDYSGAVGYVNLRPAGLVGMLQQVATNTTSTDDQSANTLLESNDFDLAFQAFLESKQLNEAEKLAKEALDRQLDPKVWTQRLAQVATWNNHPETALKYWLQYARISGSDEAWANVLELAPQLNNDQAYLAALIHASDRAPHDFALRDQIVATYERLGQPQAGMTYLKSRAKGVYHQPLLERYAALAERSGNNKAALDAYRSLSTAYPANPTYAAHFASFEYKQGHLSEALTILRDVRHQIGDSPESAPYWRLYAELAGRAQSNEDANFAYEHLLATGQSNDADLNSITDFYRAYPIDAARMAESQFQQNESQAALRASLQYYVDARAWPRIRTLLNALTPEQLVLFERSGVLLAVRAQYYLHSQRWDAALDDLRRAVRAPDADDDIKGLYIWTLVEFGTDAELNAALNKWRSAAKTNPSYWGAFAAGELRLGNAARAVIYLRQQRFQSADDPLWLMALADAEEGAGRIELAWGIRRQAWHILQTKTASRQLDEVIVANDNSKTNKVGNRLDSAERLDLLRARVTLSQIFTNGDISRSLLIDLLKQDGRGPEEFAVANSLLGDRAGLPKLDDVMAHDAKSLDGRRDVISAATKEVVLSWAISGEHNDLARAWLAREYVNRLLRPADAEITLALADNDKETLGRLLDNRQRPISIGSRIAALTQAGRTSEAETVAYAAAEGAPDNSDIHQTMVETVLRDRPTVGVDVVNSVSDSLRYVETTVVGGLKLSSRLGLAVVAKQRNQRTSDVDELAWVPAHDRELNITLRDTTMDHDMSLTVGYRKAMKSFYTAKIHGEFNRAGPLTASVTLGVNQFTDLSSHMQVGATKDTAQIGLAWNPESRWFGQVTAEANRFHAQQDRTYIGRGYEFTQQFGYRIRGSYPDWSVRLVSAQGVYSASDNTIASLGVLLPSDVTPFASEFMQQNYHQYGVMIGLGSTEADTYSRGWRPFMDVGYVHDSNAGWGPRVNLGIGGSVFGSDHLRVFFVHESAGKGTSQRVNQIGLSYRMVF